MECDETRELLSAFLDGELEFARHREISEHVSKCATCAGEAEAFQRISRVAHGRRPPAIPKDLWSGIEAELDQDRPIVVSGGQRSIASKALPSRLPPGAGRRASWAAVAVAAMVVVVVFTRYFGSPDEAVSRDFEHYASLFHRSPEQAHDYWVARFGGEMVDHDGAALVLGSDLVSERLPVDYSLVSQEAHHLPRYDCVTSVCQRKDGSTFVIFERDLGPSWFRGPTVSARCAGQRCELAELDHQVVVDLEINNHRITILGVQDLAEISSLASSMAMSTHTEEVIQLERDPPLHHPYRPGRSGRHRLHP